MFYFFFCQPAELLNQAWSKTELKYRAVNVLHMIERFNHLSSWAANSILWPDKIADRVDMYIKLIELSACLRKYNNFNSLLAVLAGLNNSAVHRLAHTRSEISEKYNKVTSNCGYYPPLSDPLI